MLLRRENQYKGANVKGPQLEGKIVLVTGGAGFIGSHLVDKLLELGAKVRVLDNFSTGKRENLSHCLDRIELVEGDVRIDKACIEACRGADYILHEAALGSVPRSMKDPSTSLDVNVGGTAKLFSAARDAEVKRIVFASSSSVYGDSSVLPKKEGGEGRPLSPYALSKVMDEHLAEVFGRCFGMKIIGLRYFNVYGARQDPYGSYAAVIPRFFKACLSGEPPVIYGDGDQTRDFTFVEDVVNANLLALAAADNYCGRSYNIAGGKPVSVNDLAGIIASLSGVPSLTPRYEAPRPGDVMHSTADLEDARQIGYSPEVSLPDGLEKSAKYYKGLFSDAPLIQR